MMRPYSKKIDEKWQKKWSETDLYHFDPDRPGEKIYLLEMFSYPSGSTLHLGHWWNYSLPDSWGRMKVMQGCNVFHPMGFDAFGLPAENYAIKTRMHPKDSTESNIQTMERQLREIGCNYDWAYELSTCDPVYYKWTQWLFLKLYEHGLAYQKDAPVNWCTNCMTTLANEQVVDGVCERCGHEVLRKKLKQWFFKITDYADELLNRLTDLDWPEKTKRIQENWIGRSEGAEIEFQVKNSDARIAVFTSRADTLMGLSYLVLAPESLYVKDIIDNKQRQSVQEYISSSMKKTEVERSSTVDEKTGVFTGSYAIHPLTGKEVPIWIADYVIASYGTGAVMAVPAHDTRDYEFAKKYGLPIYQVIADKAGNHNELPFTDHGILVNSGKFTGLSTEDAKEAIVLDLKKLGQGQQKINYRLRDWSVSRQRYWGAPIPMIHCEHCGTVPVPARDLPVLLPYDVEFRPNGQSPLLLDEEFVNTSCPVCGQPAIRETDTLDTFVCSSWYYLRYVDNRNEQQPWNTEFLNRMLPVDRYVGGIEHAAMHLLYARFIFKALRDMGYTKWDEPFTKLIHQGIILGTDGNRMSKSKGNTITPDEYVNVYGSDVFRLYLAFGFSYNDGGPWKDEGIKAIHRFVSRLTGTLTEFFSKKPDNKPEIPDSELEFIMHSTIRAVTNDLERFQFNTAVARLMEFHNAINKYQRTQGHSYRFLLRCIETFTLLISPLMPHYSEEIWEALGNSYSVYQQKWPVFEEAKLTQNAINIAVQINGKLRDTLDIPMSAEQAEIEALVFAAPKIQTALKGMKVRKVIHVEKKLVNIVVGTNTLPN